MVDPQTPPAKPRRERFKRVAERRTRRLLADIRLLANCANRSAYDYSDGDVEKIFGAIEREVATARSRFERKQKQKEVEFSIE